MFSKRLEPWRENSRLVAAEVPAAPLPSIGDPGFAGQVVALALNHPDWLEKLVAVARVVASEGLDPEDVSAILRLIIAALPDRARMAPASARIATIDPLCRQIASVAEECAANHHWDDASTAYKDCLELYPLDHRTWARLGTAYKELGRLYEAEIAFREARLLGAPESLITRALQSLPDTPSGSPARVRTKSSSLLDAPLSVDHARELARLLFSDPPEPKHVARLMRESDGKAALMQAFATAEFAKSNRQLLELIAVRWSR